MSLPLYGLCDPPCADLYQRCRASNRQPITPTPLQRELERYWSMIALIPLQWELERYWEQKTTAFGGSA